MRTQQYIAFLSLACLSCFGSTNAETDIYVFSDFGGGSHHLPISDWQTAIELASEGSKLTNHRQIFVNDSATPLNPARAGTDLAASFPYLGAHSEEIKRIVIHVIDPGVGNGSQHPRTLVLRKDGTLFIGPDNGTLSLACPAGSIAAIWEINTKHLSELTGIDLDAGGTFHGRDVFAAAAYLLAAQFVCPHDIGIEYRVPELKFRLEISGRGSAVHFQELPTNRWDIKLSPAPSENTLFSTAYFLAIAQSPFFINDAKPQLFFIQQQNIQHPIAIYNRKTSNLYVGPDNGIGTSFFEGFEREDLWIAPLTAEIYQKIQVSNDPQDAAQLILKQAPQQTLPAAIDLHARELSASSHGEVIVQGRIWLDAYGNIKTTLDTELFFKLLKKGYTSLTAHINDVARTLEWGSSFANITPGTPFVYVGSSGSAGPNPRRSHRYMEISSNGSEGVFGADLFTKDGKHLFNGQEIIFQFNIHEIK